MDSVTFDVWNLIASKKVFLCAEVFVNPENTKQQLLFVGNFCVFITDDTDVFAFADGGLHLPLKLKARFESPGG